MLGRTLAATTVLAVAGTLLASSAFAGPKPIKPISPTKTSPISPKIGDVISFGLTRAATVKPDRLTRNGVDTELINAKQVSTRKNTASMTKTTQLMLYFDATKDREYRLECNFTQTASVLVLVQTQDGNTFQQQNRVGVSSGRIVNIIDPKPENRKLRVFMQTDRDTHWTSCTLRPS